MGAFEHVLILLSFIYALALTHLLSRIVALYNARERVKVSGLLVLAMMNAVAAIFVNWLALWPLRGAKGWDIASIFAQFMFAILIFFMCALIAPEIGDKDSIDLEAFYRRQRRPFYWCF